MPLHRQRRDDQEWTPGRPRLQRDAFRLLLTVLALTIALAAAGGLLSLTTSKAVFSESGPIESATEYLWLIVALLSAILFRASAAGLAGAGLALAAAAREADWHKAFTTDSIMKPTFFTRAEHGDLPRVIAGLIIIGVIVCAFIVIRRVIVLTLRDPRRLPPWTLGPLVAVCLMVVSKSLDRSPDVLNAWFDVQFSDRALSVLRAIEEGFEAALPVLFAAAILAFARDPIASDAPAPTPPSTPNDN